MGSATDIKVVNTTVFSTLQLYAGVGATESPTISKTMEYKKKSLMTTFQEI